MKNKKWPTNASKMTIEIGHVQSNFKRPRRLEKRKYSFGREVIFLFYKIAIESSHIGFNIFFK